MIDFLDHVSYSNFNLFDTCPRCWFLKYQLGYDLPQTEALEFGTCVHDIAKRYHLGEEIDFTTYYKAYPMQLLLEQNLKAYSLLNEPKDFDVFEDKPFIEYEFLIDLVHPITKEVMPVPLKGFIDRVFNKTPRDLKTSASRYQQEQADTSKQLYLYAYAYSVITGEIPDRVIYDVLIKNIKPSPQVVYSPKEPNKKLVQKRINEALIWAFDIWEQMQTAQIPEYHSVKCLNKRSMAWDC